MSTYVFSDVHGHAAPLRRALERISPADDDRFFCLGDLVDRGPEPVDCIRATRELPNLVTIMGNHEDLMTETMLTGSHIALTNWLVNGGGVTSRQLGKLRRQERNDILEWAYNLPLWTYATVGDRLYLMVHAGIDLSVADPPEVWDSSTIKSYLSKQRRDDLLWIRDEFWCAPEGLSGVDGSGPFIIAGHTPTPYLNVPLDLMNHRPYGEDGRARMVRVAWDRWDIDSAAAAGHPAGQVLVLRLDDGEEFYEPVLRGE